MQVPGEGREREVEVVNMSGEGTFLRTTPIPLGTTVLMRFDGEIGFEMRGEVIRNDAKGVGVRLLREVPDTLSVWLKHELEAISPALPDPWAPLATHSIDVADADGEPIYIPAREVTLVLDACPGTSLERLLASGLAPSALVLIAVGRLIEAGSVYVTDADAPEKGCVKAAIRLVDDPA
jgi:hypothetical protein